MKKFDLPLAESGKELTTKSGKSAILLYSKRDNKNFPLIVLIENKEVFFYTVDGKFYVDKESDNDLFIK